MITLTILSAQFDTRDSRKVCNTHLKGVPIKCLLPPHNSRKLQNPSLFIIYSSHFTLKQCRKILISAHFSHVIRQDFHYTHVTVV